MDTDTGVSSYIEQIVPGVGITCHFFSHCVKGSADVRVNFVSVAVIWKLLLFSRASLEGLARRHLVVQLS